MIRTAEALGIDGILFSEDTCDIFSPKVVRGSMGSIFRMPFLRIEEPVAFLRELAAHGINSYAAVVDSREKSLSTCLLYTSRCV